MWRPVTIREVAEAGFTSVLAVALAALITLLAAWLAVPGRANAQEHAHAGHPEDLAMHEKFYARWMRPDSPKNSCCNNRDCYATVAKQINGHWYAQRREDGQWLDVPDEKVERDHDSPDGRSHLCAPSPSAAFHYKNGVICFVAGIGG